MATDATSCPSCHEEASRRQPVSERPFLSAAYVADAEGRYAPSADIDQCPWAQGCERCRLEKHDFRPRKTGPEVPLRVLLCHTHGHFFTVYPPGHVPYGRVALAAVDLQGEPIGRDLPEPLGSCEGTLFRGGPRCGCGPALACGADRGRVGSAPRSHPTALDHQECPAGGSRRGTE